MVRRGRKRKEQKRKLKSTAGGCHVICPDAAYITRGLFGSEEDVSCLSIATEEMMDGKTANYYETTWV